MPMNRTMIGFTFQLVMRFCLFNRHSSPTRSSLRPRRVDRWAILLTVLPALQGTASAQWGGDATSLPTTPAQQTAINQAVHFLESRGEVLAGTTITNADIPGNAPAITSGDGLSIGIDFGRIEEVIPPETPGAPGTPGILVVLIFHELQHRDHGWGGCNRGRDLCCEFGVTAYVATKHCDFICWILDGGGGPLDALCAAYKHTMDNYNAGVASGIVSHCTPGSPPASIPACPCCP